MFSSCFIQNRFDTITHLGIHMGECEMFKYLEDPNLMPVKANVMNKMGPFGNSCGHGYCSWTPEK